MRLKVWWNLSFRQGAWTEVKVRGIDQLFLANQPTTPPTIAGIATGADTRTPIAATPAIVDAAPFNAPSMQLSLSVTFPAWWEASSKPSFAVFNHSDWASLSLDVSGLLILRLDKSIFWILSNLIANFRYNTGCFLIIFRPLPASLVVPQHNF